MQFTEALEHSMEIHGGHRTPGDPAAATGRHA
jgi:hypothetical protein